MAEPGGAVFIMSIELMAAIEWLDLRLHLKLTLMILGDNADGETGVCWPTVACIAFRTSRSARQSQRTLQELATAGWVTTLKEGGGRGHATERQLDHARILAEGAQRKALFYQQRAEYWLAKGDAGVGVSEERVTPMRIKGDAGVTPTVIEPSSLGRENIPTTSDRQRTKKQRSSDRLSPEERQQAILEDADFMTYMVEKYGDDLGGRAAVVECIRGAFNHTSSLKWLSDKIGVSRWLAREVAMGWASPPASRGNQPRPTPASRGGARHPFPEKYRGMSSSPPRPPPGPPLSPGRPGGRHLVHTGNEKEEQP